MSFLTGKLLGSNILSAMQNAPLTTAGTNALTPQSSTSTQSSDSQVKSGGMTTEEDLKSQYGITGEGGYWIPDYTKFGSNTVNDFYQFVQTNPEDAKRDLTDSLFWKWVQTEPTTPDWRYDNDGNLIDLNAGGTPDTAALLNPTTGINVHSGWNDFDKFLVQAAPIVISTTAGAMTGGALGGLGLGLGATASAAGAGAASGMMGGYISNPEQNWSDALKQGTIGALTGAAGAAVPAVTNGLTQTMTPYIGQTAAQVAAPTITNAIAGATIPTAIAGLQGESHLGDVALTGAERGAMSGLASGIGQAIDTSAGNVRTPGSLTPTTGQTAANAIQAAGSTLMGTPYQNALLNFGLSELNPAISGSTGGLLNAQSFAPALSNALIGQQGQMRGQSMGQYGDKAGFLAALKQKIQGRPNQQMSQVQQTPVAQPQMQYPQFDKAAFLQQLKGYVGANR